MDFSAELVEVFLGKNSRAKRLRVPPSAAFIRQRLPQPAQGIHWATAIVPKWNLKDRLTLEPGNPVLANTTRNVQPQQEGEQNGQHAKENCAYSGLLDRPTSNG